ncbi:unnamed protein product [Polarella glacialis]|uniref:Uncharacterized protein n=1 Tax=Polarella glacialis TaxID=89957 RepID=A0A813J0B7_POLGL|nr:unnamed protein product [Polarella glacialis]
MEELQGNACEQESTQHPPTRTLAPAPMTTAFTAKDNCMPKTKFTITNTQHQLANTQTRMNANHNAQLLTTKSDCRIPELANPSSNDDLKTCSRRGNASRQTSHSPLLSSSSPRWPYSSCNAGSYVGNVCSKSV